MKAKIEGFTLLEVLLSITILSLILSIVYFSYSQAISLINRGREEIKIYQTARLALTTMIKDLSSASLFAKQSKSTPIFKGEFRGENKEEEGFPRDSLDFSISSFGFLLSQGKRAGVINISYSWKRDSEGNPLFYKEESLSLEGEREAGGIIRQWGKEIKGVDFKFYDERRERFEEWNWEEGIQKDKIPPRVDITLFLSGKEGKIYPFFSQAYLPLAQKKSSEGKNEGK